MIGRLLVEFRESTIRGQCSVVGRAKVGGLNPGPATQPLLGP